MKYLICYDIGTSGIKCGLFDEDLNCRIITRCSYEVKMTQDKTAEAEPEAYISGIAQCTREALAESGVPARDVACLCSTTQGETLIPVDKRGMPLYRAIVWLDGRAEEEAEILRKTFPDAVFKEKTGLPSVDGYTPLAKLMHIRCQMPEVYEKTDKFLLLEDYVTYRLTGKKVSEKSLLSSTGYFDLRADAVWQEALDAAGIDGAKIPQAVCPGEKIGNLTEQAAKMLGLTEDTAVYAGAMDQIAGAVGCGNCEPGRVHETTGTAMIVAATGTLDECMARGQDLTVYRHAQDGQYLLLSISRTATTVLKWFAEQFCEDRADIYEYLSAVAAEGKPGANGLQMFPYFEGLIGGDALKGAFWNVGLHNTKADFVRAIFEGVAYMLEDNIRLLFPDGQNDGALVSIGGASRSEIWSRIKAGVTNREIITMPQTEAALLGSACIAAVGAGIFPSLRDAAEKQTRRVHYQPEDVEAYRAEYRKYLKLKETLIDMYHCLGRDA